MKKSNKIIALAAATVLAITGHPASADDRYDFIPARNAYPHAEVVSVKATRALAASIEEVMVTAKDIRELVKPTVQVFNLRTGLENRVLVHVYDQKTNTWKFVGTDPSVVYDIEG